MKIKSLTTRWVVYQTLISFGLFLFVFIGLDKVVHSATLHSLKATVESLQAKIDPNHLESYFIKNQPALVGLYRPDGQAVYLPENDLPQTASDALSHTYDKTSPYLVYAEKMDNGYTFISFTVRERIFVMQHYFNQTTILVLGICFILSSLGTYFLLKKLYHPIENLASSMDRSFHELSPINIEKFYRIDPKITKLISVYNHLIRTVQAQFKSLDAQQKKQRLILNTLQEGICLISKENKILFINPKAQLFLKTTAEKIPSDLFSHTDLGQKLIELTSTLSKTAQKDKCIDHSRHFEITLEPLEDSQTLIVLYDETDRIEKMEAGKNFVSNASHELRTPITVIRGFAETLLEEGALEHVKLPDVMGKVLNACDRMEKLIKRLLLLADVDQKALEISSFDIASSAQGEIHLFKTLHPEAAITYTGPKSILYSGDEELLKIVIHNLIGNGIKYSSGNPKIHLLLEEETNFVLLKVKDQGIGIPEKDLSKIFTRFYRVDKARTRKMGGAGLGLSLVKTIIDKHGGDIEVHSTLGEGSEFIIKLPKTLI